MAYIPGKIQEVRYGGTTELLYFPTRLDGRDVKPSAITVTLYDPSGTQLLTATAMTAVAVTTEGWETYATRTAEFTLGATVTEGTSNATGVIKEQTIAGAAGALYLVDIRGTWVGSKPITDNGDKTGAATSSGVPWLALYYYSLNAAIATYPLGEMYQAKVLSTVDAVAYVDWFYFDVVFSPYRPLVTSREINEKHPEWIALRDEHSHDWQPAILAGHKELSSRIRALGKRPYLMIGDEIRELEFAYIEAQIARNYARFKKEDREDWENNREQAWNRYSAAFRYRDDTSTTGDLEEETITLGSRITR